MELHWSRVGTETAQCLAQLCYFSFRTLAGFGFGMEPGFSFLPGFGFGLEGRSRASASCRASASRVALSAPVGITVPCASHHRSQVASLPS